MITPRRSQFRSAAAAGMAAVLSLGLVACTSNDPDPQLPSRASAATSAPLSLSASPTASPTPAQEQQILAQYRAVWPVFDQAARAPAAQRRALLARYLTDPALTSTLEQRQALDAQGRTIWGESDVPLTQTIEVTGASATVRGCVDSSRGGEADAKTGRKLTVGPPKNPAIVQMKRGADGVWRGSFFTLPGGTC